jgi:hypothetical protein
MLGDGLMPQAAGAVVGEWLAFAGAGATWTAVGVAVTEVVVAAVINEAISSVLSSGQSTGQGGTAAPQQLNTTIRQAAAQRRLVYGQVKAGGILVYPAQSVDGQWMDFAIYLGEGPWSSIDPVFWVGDELSSEPKFSARVYATLYTGSAGQVASAALMAASGGEWTSAHIGTGCAWVHVSYAHDRNAFPRGRLNALPTFLANARLCYDPRTGTTAWTNNAALVMLDYIRCQYGPNGGVPDDQIDFDNFAAQASICDEVLDSIDPANVVDGVPGKVRRYTVNGAFEVGGGHTQTIQTLEQACAGRLVNDGEKYRLYVGAWRAPTGPVLTSEYLREAPEFQTHPTRQQRINTVRGTYREPRQDWQDIDYQQQQIAAAVLEEDGEIVQAINFPVTTNGATAQRLAWLAMQRARTAVPLELKCNWAAFQWKLYDTIQVLIPEADADGVYLIEGYTLAEGGGVDLVLLPHTAEQFAWDAATQETIVPTVVRPNFNTTPPPMSGLVVTSATLFTSSDSGSYGLLATWTVSGDVYLMHYQTQYKRTADADWIDGGTTTTGTWEKPLTTDVEYDFRVRAVRNDNSVNEWATETNITVNGDVTPPSVPTDLSVSGTTTHAIGWKNPGSLDVMRARVYANEVSADAGSAVEVAEIFGLPSTAYTTDHTPGAVPTWYWVTAVDRSGNESARTYAGTAS